MNGIKIIVVNVLILLIGVLAVELIFGNWLSPNRLNQLNILKSVKLQMDIGGLYENPTGTASYVRDKYGFRSEYNNVNSIDILTIGGSTTDQRYISEGRTWQDIMAQEFNKKGLSISVVNAGIDGQSTYGHLKNFDWWFPQIPDLKVKYILCYVGINDFYKDDGYKFDKLRQPDDSRMKVLIKERSAIYYIFRTVKGMYEATYVHNVSHRAIDFGSVNWTNKPLQQDHASLMKNRLKLYKGRLKELSRKINQMGSKAIFVTQPSRAYRWVDGSIYGKSSEDKYGNVNINGVDYFYMLRLLNKTTVETAQELGIQYVDLGNDLQFEDGDFYDYFHNTPLGARKIGEYLAAKLMPILSHGEK